MHTEKNLLDAQVSRRNFVNLTAGTLASIPVVGGLFRVPTAQAQESEALQPQSEIDYGELEAKISDSVTVYVLKKTEVGFYVVDTTDSTGETKVSGFYVRVENDKGVMVDGRTDSNGVCKLDVAELVDNPDNLPINQLEEFNFVGCIWISKDGYRDFKMPCVYIEANSAIRVPTRPLTKGMLYPYSFTCDSEDMLYSECTKGQTYTTDMNDHNITLEFRNCDPGSATISLKAKGFNEPIVKKTVRVVDGVAKAVFINDFFNARVDSSREDTPFPLAESYVALISQGATTYSVTTGLWIEPAPAPDMQNSLYGEQEQYNEANLDLTQTTGAGTGLKFRWPQSVPLVGGQMCDLSFLKFFGLGITFDYLGQIVISIKTPALGKKLKWKEGLLKKNNGNWPWDDSYSYRKSLSNGWSKHPLEDLKWDFRDKYREVFGGIPSYAQNYQKHAGDWRAHNYDDVRDLLDSSDGIQGVEHKYGSAEFFQERMNNLYGTQEDRAREQDRRHEEALEAERERQRLLQDPGENGAENAIGEGGGAGGGGGAGDGQNQPPVEGDNNVLQPNENNNPAGENNNPEGENNNPAGSNKNFFNKQYLSQSIEFKFEADLVIMLKWSKGKEYEKQLNADGTPKTEKVSTKTGDIVHYVYKTKKDENNKDVKIASAKALLSKGSLAVHGTFSCSYSVSIYFYAGPVPLTFQFSIGITATIGFSVGMQRYERRPLDSKDLEWDDMFAWAFGFGSYEFDWINTGFCFTLNIKISVAFGVGVRSLFEVCIKGTCSITLVWSFPFSRPDNVPVVHFKSGGDFKLTAVFKALVFSHEIPVWDKKLWAYDNWDGLAVEGQADDTSELPSISNGLLQEEDLFKDLNYNEFITKMKPLDTSFLEDTAEQVQSNEMLLPQGEEDYDPVDWKELVGPVVTAKTDEGLPITYRIINFPEYYDEDEEEQEQEQETVLLGSDSEVELGADEANDLGLNTASAKTTKRRKYRRPAFKNYEVLPNGITPMASESEFLRDPDIEGVSDYGGIIPDVRVPLHGGEKGVFGDARVKVIEFTIDQKFVNYIVDEEKHNIVFITAELRIGTALVGRNKVPRTRIIMTILDARYSDGERATGQIVNAIRSKRERVLDFPFSVYDHEDFVHEDFYDYDFDVKRKTTNVAQEGSDIGEDIIQLAVISGTGEYDEEEGTPIGQIATNIIFTYVSFHISDWFAKDIIKLDQNLAMVAAEANPDLMDDGLLHNFSNLSISGGDKEGDKYAVIGFLDRYTDSSDGADTYSNMEDMVGLTAGIITVEFDRKKYIETGSRMVVSSRTDIATLLGDTTLDLNIGGLEITPVIENYYTLILYSRSINYYYLFKVGTRKATVYNEETERYEDVEFPGITTSTYAGAKNLKLIPCSQKKCFFTAEYHKDENGEEGRVLCEAHWTWDEDGVVSLTTTPIGNEKFNITSFAMNGAGTFLFWVMQWHKPEAGREIAVYNEDMELEENSVSEYENQAMYFLYACRIRKDSFSEPFIVGSLPYEMNDLQVVSSRNRYSALQTISREDIDSGEVDEDGNRVFAASTLWYTAIPNVHICTAIKAYAKNPFVIPGQYAYFYVTIRNDGNSYLDGCTLQMYLHTGDEVVDGEIVKYGDITDVVEVEGAYNTIKFNEKTLEESSYTPIVDGKFTNVEDDFALAPGKTAVYKVGIPIPDDWNGDVGIYRVSFVAESPTVADGGSMSAQDDDNGLEPIYITRSVQPGSVRVYANRTNLKQSDQQRFMTTLDVDRKYGDQRMLHDAPVVVGDATVTPGPKAAEGNAANGNNGISGASANSAGAGAQASGDAANGASGSESGKTGTAGVATASVGARQATAKTADTTSGVLPAALAAAGAAVMAYEKRRAKNEEDVEDAK